MSKKRKWLTHNRPVFFLQYVLLRYIILLLSPFTMPAVLQFGKRLGMALHFMDVKHRGIAYQNMERSNGPWSHSDRLRIIREVYQHIGISLMEALFATRFLSRDRISRYVSFENDHYLEETLRAGKGVIAVIGHLGNWELCGLAFSWAGYPLNSVARPIENPYLNRYLEQFRTSKGQTIIVKYNALPAMTGTLRENRILVIEVDQDVRQKGVFVDFLGRPAATTRSPALLSLRYGIPIMPVNIHRDRLYPVHHRVVFDPPIYPQAVDRAADKVHALTQLYTSRFEAFVREHPGQWLWIHRRWKTQPEGVTTPAGSIMSSYAS